MPAVSSAPDSGGACFGKSAAQQVLQADAVPARLKSNVRQLDMNQLNELKECKRCGEEISLSAPNISIVMELQKSPKEKHLQILVAEGISQDIAEQWLLHEYYSSCQKKIAHCPYCNSELATSRAKQCLSCHRQWHTQVP